MKLTNEKLMEIYLSEIKPRVEVDHGSLFGSCILMARIGKEVLESHGYDVIVAGGVHAAAVNHNGGAAISYGRGKRVFHPEAGNFWGHAWLVERSTGHIIDFTNAELTNKYRAILNIGEVEQKNLLGDDQLLITKNTLSEEDASKDGTIGFYYKRTGKLSVQVKDTIRRINRGEHL